MLLATGEAALSSAVFVTDPGQATLRRMRPEQLVQNLHATADQLLADGAGIGELKIATAALREMRDAFALFAPYRRMRKIACFGSARTQIGDPVFRLAEHFAQHAADGGFMVITGAGPGIMEACQRGAGRERSFGANILLPFEQEPNIVIRDDTKLMSFKYFFTRKLFFIKEAHGVALFPGGFGTLDEGFEVLTLLQTGKCQPLPLVMLDAPRGTYWRSWDRYVRDHLLRRNLISPEDLALYTVTDSVDVAMQELSRFYLVYHSSRYVRDLLVLRLNRTLRSAAVAEIADEFKDIIVSGSIIQRRAFPVERDDPDAWHLPRLVFRFDRTHFGRLRMLIDKVNSYGREAGAAVDAATR